MLITGDCSTVDLTDDIMRYFIVIFLCFSGFVLNAQQDVIDSARSLVNEKQYYSAWELLHSADPRNNNPRLLEEKTTLVSSYFVNSINHVLFGLKDLEEDETVMDYRGKPGSYDMIKFDADSLTRRLIRKNGKDYLLYRNLANYWFEVYLSYANSLESGANPLDTVQKYSAKALKHGDEHFRTYYLLAYCFTMDQSFQKAIPLFRKSIQQNDTFPASHYNLGYAYLFTNQQANAVIHANEAFRLYQDSLQKADAARMAGIALMELGKPDKAQMFYERSMDYSPGDYNTLQNMLQLYFATGDADRADSVATEIFARAPASPRVIDDLANLYRQEGKTADFTSLMQEQLEEYEGRYEAKGNIYFGLAKLKMEAEPVKAKEYLLKARENFAEVLPGSHYVFNVILQALEHIEKTE